MNVDFEKGEVLALLTEDDRKLIGIASTAEGFNQLIEDTFTDEDDWIIKWVHTTKDDCLFDIYVTVSFDDGDQREEHFKAAKYHIYA